MKEIFYQSSLPRSGSTLLQNILAQNNDIYATPTSPLSDYLNMCREVYSTNANVIAQNEEEMKLAFKNMCKNAMKGYFQGLTNKNYAIDKSRGWINNYTLLSFINDKKPKVICMVRDLRDIFCSNEKNYRKNPHKSKQSVGMATATTVPKRIDVWASGDNFTGSSIDFLNDAIRTGIAKDILFIKYEELCLYPENTLKNVYDYLEIPHHKHDFENVLQITQENDQLHGIFGVHSIRPLVSMNISDANEVLGRDVCDWIFNNYRWFFDYFGYKN